MANELDKPRNWAAEIRDCKPPVADLKISDDNVLTITISGNWERIVTAAGNTSVGNGIIGHAAHLGTEGKSTDADGTNFVLGFIDAMDPKDAAEVMLLGQMAATHQAVMMLARHLNRAKSIPQKDCAEKALNKTARTFASQMEALKRYRSKGQQVVRVERVTVEAGGQAVVGNVETGGGGGGNL